MFHHGSVFIIDAMNAIGISTSTARSRSTARRPTSSLALSLLSFQITTTELYETFHGGFAVTRNIQGREVVQRSLFVTDTLASRLVGRRPRNDAASMMAAVTQTQRIIRSCCGTRASSDTDFQDLLLLQRRRR